MLRVYYKVTKNNFEKVIAKGEELGYKRISPETKLEFPTCGGDVFVCFYFNQFANRMEWMFSTHSLAKSVGIRIPNGLKEGETFVYDEGYIYLSSLGERYNEEKRNVVEKGLWNIFSDVKTLHRNDNGSFHYVTNSSHKLSDEIFGGSANMSANDLLHALLLFYWNDMEDSQKESIPLLANFLEWRGELDFDITIPDTHIKYHIKKTNMFRLKNQRYGWIRPMVLVPTEDGVAEKFIEFSYIEDEFIFNVAQAFGVEMEEAKRKPVYLPYCTTDGFRTGDMCGTFESATEAFKKSLWHEERAAEGNK